MSFSASRIGLQHGGGLSSSKHDGTTACSVTSFGFSGCISSASSARPMLTPTTPHPWYADSKIAHAARSRHVFAHRACLDQWPCDPFIGLRSFPGTNTARSSPGSLIGCWRFKPSPRTSAAVSVVMRPFLRARGSRAWRDRRRPVASTGAESTCPSAIPRRRSTPRGRRRPSGCPPNHRSGTPAPQRGCGEVNSRRPVLPARGVGRYFSAPVLRPLEVKGRDPGTLLVLWPVAYEQAEVRRINLSRLARKTESRLDQKSRGGLAAPAARELRVGRARVMLAARDLVEDAAGQLVRPGHRKGDVLHRDVSKRDTALIRHADDSAASRLPAAHLLDRLGEHHHVVRAVHESPELVEPVAHGPVQIDRQQRHSQRLHPRLLSSFPLAGAGARR